jgi:hypothetical protein
VVATPKDFFATAIAESWVIEPRRPRRALIRFPLANLDLANDAVTPEFSLRFAVSCEWSPANLYSLQLPCSLQEDLYAALIYLLAAFENGSFRSKAPFLCVCYVAYSNTDCSSSVPSSQADYEGKTKGLLNVVLFGVPFGEVHAN